MYEFMHFLPTSYPRFTYIYRGFTRGGGHIFNKRCLAEFDEEVRLEDDRLRTQTKTLKRACAENSKSTDREDLIRALLFLLDLWKDNKLNNGESLDFFITSPRDDDHSKGCFYRNDIRSYYQNLFTSPQYFLYLLCIVRPDKFSFPSFFFLFFL